MAQCQELTDPFSDPRPLLKQINQFLWRHTPCVDLWRNGTETRLSVPPREETQPGLIYRRLFSSSHFTWAPLCLIGLIMWLTWQIYPLPSRHSFERRRTTNHPKVTLSLKPQSQQLAISHKEVSVLSIEMLVCPQSPLHLWLNIKGHKWILVIIHCTSPIMPMHIMLLVFDMQSTLPEKTVDSSQTFIPYL